MQAFNDFQLHKNGFDRAQGWSSEIEKRFTKQ